MWPELPASCLLLLLCPAPPASPPSPPLPAHAIPMQSHVTGQRWLNHNR